MVKSIVMLRRRPDLTHEEFDRHWRQVHAPLVLQLPGICRYVQNRPVDVGGEPPHDGVSEVWFDDMEALRAATSSPIWPRILEDEKNFLAEQTPRSELRLTVTEDEMSVPSDER